jgi:hypothetical protein
VAGPSPVAETSTTVAAAGPAPLPSGTAESASTPTPSGAPRTEPAPDSRSPEPGSTPSSSPDTPISTVVPDPPPNGSTGSTPQRVTVNPAAVDLRPRPFESAVPLGSASVGVRFWGGVPECDPIGRVDVQETATTVTITLYSGRPPGEPMACIAIALYQELLVELSSPLGDRTIVDGAA